MTKLRQRWEDDADFAFVEFGLSEEQFFRQTPREWQRRLNQWRESETRKDRRIARLCCVIAMAAGASSATEDEFMPRPRDDSVQTPEEMIAVLHAIDPKRPKQNG
jgi:hypothetical protein